MQHQPQIAPSPRLIANDRNDPASYRLVNGGQRQYPPFNHLGWEVSRTDAGQYIAQKGDDVVYGMSVSDVCAAAANAAYVEGLPFEAEPEGNHKLCTCVMHKHRNWGAMAAQGIVKGSPNFRPDIHCIYCDGTGWVL